MTAPAAPQVCEQCGWTKDRIQLVMRRFDMEVEGWLESELDVNNPEVAVCLNCEGHELLQRFSQAAHAFKS